MSKKFSWGEAIHTHKDQSREDAPKNFSFAFDTKGNPWTQPPGAPRQLSQACFFVLRRGGGGGFVSNLEIIANNHLNSF